ncbi:hypothetical protein [Luteibacter sp. 3190]|uniref:hypothetical protein n=1 Tax=Luteibacter sp. 3190 TaxID=2817736 RepID=UPI0028609A07|nr:hypothetical protein [Luteibacter sp. 3190]MDR6936824.1 hypothetical protein [Luteibacter sp. 3190]
MRRSLLTMLLLMPLAAAGQVAPVGQDATANRLLGAGGPTDPSSVPLWRAPDGRALSLRSDDRADPTQPLALRPVESGPALTSGLQYDIGPRVQAHASVSGQGWINSAESCGAGSRGDRCSTPGAPPRIVGSEVGATYRGSGYSVGLGVGSSRPTGTGAALPRVLPGLATASGLPIGALSSSTEFNAHGRVDLGARSGIDLGASIGRIRLLPGNLLGIGSVDQKALSFGVDRGPLSGLITGRTMQPEANAVNGLNPDRRWSAIDLGVTWRLPWRGELSVGAQNVWSSGNAPSGPVGPEPDQSRTPYVQYHQDL